MVILSIRLAKLYPAEFATSGDIWTNGNHLPSCHSEYLLAPVYFPLGDGRSKIHPGVVVRFNQLLAISRCRIAYFLHTARGVRPIEFRIVLALLARARGRRPFKWKRRLAITNIYRTAEEEIRVAKGGVRPDRIDIPPANGDLLLYSTLAILAPTR
jgi:hypothetical protein